MNVAGGQQAKAAEEAVREAGRAQGTEGLVRMGRSWDCLPSARRNHENFKWRRDRQLLAILGKVEEKQIGPEMERPW